MLHAYETELGTAIHLLLLVTGVLVARVVLFSGRQPRISAMLGGGGVYVSFGLFHTEWADSATSLYANTNGVTVAVVLFILGPVYLTGCMLAGAIFGLFIDVFLSGTSRHWDRLKQALASAN